MFISRTCGCTIWTERRSSERISRTAADLLSAVAAAAAAAAGEEEGMRRSRRGGGDEEGTREGGVLGESCCCVACESLRIRLRVQVTSQS